MKHNKQTTYSTYGPPKAFTSKYKSDKATTNVYRAQLRMLMLMCTHLQWYPSLTSGRVSVSDKLKLSFQCPYLQAKSFVDWKE